MIRSFALTLPLLWFGAQCAPAPSDGSPDPMPPCQGSIVEIAPGATLNCDLTPPQILIEVGDDLVDCDLMGGTWYGSSRPGSPDLCIDIDY